MALTDFYDDLNLQQLYAFEHLTGVPEFVKSASPDPTSIAALPSEAFADPAHRKFPCHTKAATWLANAYFQHSKGFYSANETRQIESRLKKHAGYWKIANLLDQFNTKWEKMAAFNEPKELPNDQYALVFKLGEQTIRRMPMPTPASVKAAAEYLFANRQQYTYPMRKMAARRILKKAIEFDDMYKKGELESAAPSTRFSPETQNYLERAAGFGMTHPALVAEKIAQRVLMVRAKQPEIGAKLAELSLELADRESTTPEELSKLAEVIDAVDRDTGLYGYYHQGVDMPEEFLFDVLEKDAADVLDSQVVLTTGNTYPLGLLMQLPVEKIAEVMGNDFIDAVSTAGSLDANKVAEIVPTLPRTDAVLLERAIEAFALEPIEKGARAARAADLTFGLDETLNVMKEKGNARTGDFSIAVQLNHPQKVK